MLSNVIFILVLLLPLLIFVFSNLTARAREIGIAGGIKRPSVRKPKEPKARKATAVRFHRVTYCGRGLTHFALALVGSQDACRYCTHREAPADPSQAPVHADDADAAIAEVEHLLDESQH